ncbi:UNVERIFIED_CONTAM: putative vacuolar amino acid transporter YPQ1 [Sesamum angustifolium]|uniref:Vacuolar amino acid transporter YPQ1 n=1 Tax=Sesamum angustifolium TaxID=2727405 RepID=A0AAW2L650_9LAMI
MKRGLKLSYCRAERKPCVRWIEEVFKDCLCNLNDQISFGLGIASLVCWSVAEIPQIITNFTSKSAAGVSLAFLSTWIIGGKLSYCRAERKPCVRWIEEVFKDCLCNPNDQISFGLGIASLVCWSVAEIPQIITNFTSKSAAGVSLAFLSAWIIGDIFNLVGCILEPTTLYTTVTIILALQCVYYNHFRHWWKRSHKEANMVKEETEPLQPKLQNGGTASTNASIEVPRRRDFYFMSARSLAGSNTPPTQCYIKARSGPPALDHHSHSSSDEDDYDNNNNNESVFPPPSSKTATQPRQIPRQIPRQVKYGTFVAAASSLPLLGEALRRALEAQPQLQENEFSENAFGEWLGWLMAAIYMGGRIPQIWLNIKRGNVEGLNPLMFVFALIANATYTGSILVRNSEWRMIKANMPWLLDAIVCVGLDLFIILQYIFYKYVKLKKREEYYSDYVEADKPA